jgi:integrase
MVKAAGLEGLRFHDLRHTANTALAEDPEVSPETRIAIAGHSTLDSNSEYTHPRSDAKRKAVERLEERRGWSTADLGPAPSTASETEGSSTSSDTVN